MMRLDFVVRPAQFDDLPEIRDVHRASILDLAPAFYTAEHVRAWGREKAISEYEQAFETSEIYFVACLSDKTDIIIGFSSYIFREGRHTVRAVYVLNDYGRQGVGAALLKAVECYALTQGAEDIYLASSLIAEAFYGRHGYVCGKRYDVKLDGTYGECVDMHKRLRV